MHTILKPDHAKNHCQLISSKKFFMLLYIILKEKYRDNIVGPHVT